VPVMVLQNHTGHASGGHYTFDHVLLNNARIRYDDTSVTMLDASHQDGVAPYVVCYVAVDAVGTDDAPLAAYNPWSAMDCALFV